ncbi:MAG: hypothetical protein U1F64_06330 [Burkholderiales bacterium]
MTEIFGVPVQALLGQLQFAASRHGGRSARQGVRRVAVTGERPALERMRRKPRRSTLGGAILPWQGGESVGGEHEPGETPFRRPEPGAPRVRAFAQVERRGASRVRSNGAQRGRPS